MDDSNIETITWDELCSGSDGRTLGGFIAHVCCEDAIVNLVTHGTTPHYQLISEDLVDPAIPACCIAIKVDRFKRDVSHVRSVLRCTDIVFRLVDNEFTAILRRHPQYQPRAARFVAESGAIRVGDAASYRDRLAWIGTRVDELHARLNRLAEKVHEATTP